MSSMIKGLSGNSIMIVLTEEDPYIKMRDFLNNVKEGETYYLKMQKVKDTSKKMSTHITVYEV